MVPFRVPSSLPPSQGVLRLHSQRDCHPYVETRQIQDEKCPQNCTSKCLEIPFRLASSIRQILLIADKTDYQPGETGTVVFRKFDHFFFRVELERPKNFTSFLVLKFKVVIFQVVIESPSFQVFKFLYSNL